jgi:multidrug efflux system membrane fusion protein
MRTQVPTFRDLLFTTIAVAGLFGGSALFYGASHATSAAAQAQAQAPVAVPVGVQTLAPQDVRLWSSFSGRTRAVDYAEIRPEVSGKITEIRFTDGQDVKAGAVLFVIDPAPYIAAAAKAEANLASARSAEKLAAIEADRAAKLLPNQNVPVSVYDQRVNDVRVAQAAVQAAEAQLKQARIDLDHAYVKAPIAGRISRAELTVGNLVQTGPNPPVLTTIASSGDIYVDFEVDEQTYLASIRANAVALGSERQVPVEVSAQGDASHVYRGRIESFDNRIDTASGTIRARARFANDDGALVPGMFVSVKLASAHNPDTLLVPERAVSTDQNKKFVYVVGQDNKVAYRETTLGPQVGAARVVLSGLSAGDRVITDGVQHVRPNVLVAAKEEAPASGVRLSGE